MREITIAPEPPDSTDGRRLVDELDGVLNPRYAPEDRHGYDLTRLMQPGVHFFIVRVGREAAGCGAVHLIDAAGGDVAYGEVKRMYVRPGFRGLGLGRKLLHHLCRVAGASGRSVVRLETGIHQHEAIGLYEAEGFERIPPFGSYRVTEVSLCYEKHLPGEGARPPSGRSS